MDTPWLGLVIGNSRLHWAGFQGQRWLGTWHTPHLTANEAKQLADQGFASSSWKTMLDPSDLHLPGSDQELWQEPWSELWVASVAASQAQHWQSYDWVRQVQRQMIPIDNLYATLGVDRALALLGAGNQYGWPALVVDGGTALTLTGGCQVSEGHYQFIGGAILPGLSLQAQSLVRQTEALPPITFPDGLPPRWAEATESAIQGGILYTILSGLRDYLADWWCRHPQGRVIFTGGNGDSLRSYLEQAYPDAVRGIRVDNNLVFWGLRDYRSLLIGS